MNSYLTNTPDTFEHGPFQASDLPNVLDRVETPVHILDGDTVVRVYGVNRDLSAFDENGNHNYTFDRSCTVELFGAVHVLDAPDGVKYYCTRDGDIVCAEHGAPFDIGVEDGAVWPVFDVDMSDRSAVEYCSGSGQHGHSFCTCCGSGIDPDDMSAVLARCWNCHTESVYVDGHGFSWTDGWGSMLDAHNVEVRGVTVTYRTDLNGSTRIDRVEDVSGTDPTRVRFFLAFLDDDPSAGCTLILSAARSFTADAWDCAWETAVDLFEVDEVDPDDLDADEVDPDGPDADDPTPRELQAEEIRADQRAALQVVEVDRDRVTVTSKR